MYIFRDNTQKAGNARSKLLAYRSFSYIQTMPNGEVDFAQFLIIDWFGNLEFVEAYKINGDLRV